MKLYSSRLILFFFLLQSALLHAAEIQPRIIGGVDADNGEWPATVALLVTAVYNSELSVGATTGEAQLASQFCAGSLQTPNWVLTAAHCLYDQNNLRQTSEIMALADVTSLLDAGQLRVVTNIIVHPDYIPGLFDNDLALLELSNEVVAPANEIALFQNDPAVGSDVTVVGWGDTTNNNGVLPETLQEVVLQVVSNTDCNAASVFNGAITDNMLCATATGKDSCTGDSGGPLMAEQEGEFRQVGIVSFGNQCALPGFPGVYTRVARFNTWITDILANGFDPTDTGTTIDGSSTSIPDTIDPTQVLPPSGSGVADAGSSGGGSLGWMLLPIILFSCRRNSSTKKA